MKNLLLKFALIFSTVILISTFPSCKKNVPSSKVLYIGEWQSSDGTTLITIESDGSGAYEYADGGRTENINGKCKFTSEGFKIKFLVSKKFAVSQEPTAISSSSIGYTYVAIFNGQNYYRY